MEQGDRTPARHHAQMRASPLSTAGTPSGRTSPSGGPGGGANEAWARCWPPNGSPSSTKMQRPRPRTSSSAVPPSTSTSLLLATCSAFQSKTARSYGPCILGSDTASAPRSAPMASRFFGPPRSRPPTLKRGSGTLGCSPEAIVTLVLPPRTSRTEGPNNITESIKVRRQGHLVSVVGLRPGRSRLA